MAGADLLLYVLDASEPLDAAETTIEKVQMVVVLYQDGYVFAIGVAGFSRSDKGEFHLTLLVCRGGS